MRVLALAGLALMAVGSIAASGAARAQTYGPNYPVCLEVYAPMHFFECNYTSRPQCETAASGRSAQCVVNPYFANAYREPPSRHHRGYRYIQ